MYKFLLKRFLSSLPVLVGVATLVFFLIHFIPGDPIDIMLGDSAQEVDKALMRSRLGLDKPLSGQYLDFWKNLANGTWGHSITYEESVLSLILRHFPASIWLSFSSLLVGLCLSLPLGVLSAHKVGSWVDRFATSFALIGMSLPIFVLAPMAVLMFAIELRWLPVSGFADFKHLILPALCLGVGLSGVLTRMLRTSMLDVLNEDFVRTARSKGLRESAVIVKHTLRNALIPVVTILGNMLGNLLSGAVLTETLFDFPGIGKLFYQAFQSRDFPLVQGVVLWIAGIYVVVNILVDLVYSLIDPRIRLEA